MTPLPAALGGTGLVAWRLDQEVYAASWDNGEGAYLAGGRWNSRGVRAVYCSLDTATAILEVAVHKGFGILDTTPHTLTAITVGDPAQVYVVDRRMVPNPNWLRPGIPSAGQQKFGDELLRQHRCFVIPSAVSTYSWNLIFLGASGYSGYTVRQQKRFALDPRLPTQPAPDSRACARRIRGGTEASASGRRHKIPVWEGFFHYVQESAHLGTDRPARALQCSEFEWRLGHRSPKSQAPGRDIIRDQQPWQHRSTGAGQYSVAHHQQR